MTAESILVLGAGELGAPILESLAAHPQRQSRPITVLLRPSTVSSPSAAKATQLEHFRSLGIKIQPGDVVADSEPTLVAAFAGFDTIVGATGMTGGAGTQLKICRAALAAGARRYLPWQFGVDYDVIGSEAAEGLFAEQCIVRDLLRGQTLTEWVIVSTGMFMSFLFEESFGVVIADRGTVRALGSWKNKVTVTCVEDIGRVVAEVIFAVPELRGDVIFVAGDTVSYAGLADSLEQVLARPLKKEIWTLDYLQKELAADPKDGMKKYRVAFGEGTGVSWDARRTFNQKRDIAMTGLDEWMQRNLK